jgi:hypothetical protein
MWLAGAVDHSPPNFNELIIFNQMELVSGVGSFVMSVLDTEAELKRLLEKMDVLIDRAEKLLLQANFDDVADK